MTVTTYTEKQQQAIEALEGARREGLKLTAYAKSRGLSIRELYDAIAALRRKGALPKPMRKPKGKFVAVQVVQDGHSSSPSATRSTSDRMVLCRIVHAGMVIECTQWPPPVWVAALASRPADAAT